jgi:putative ABC transport system permease protein
VRHSGRPAGLLRRSGGVLRLLVRLGLRDTRSHPLGPLLLAITVAVAATALTLVFEVAPAANAPWDATWRAAGGPHVVVVGTRGTDLDRVLAAPEVREVAGPYPLVYDRLESGPYVIDVGVVGRDPEPAAVDQPVVTHGSWVRPGGVVIEGSLAGALGLGVGDSVSIGGRDLAVVGIAASGAQKPVAFSEPGLVLADRRDVEAIVAQGADGFETASLRLSDPGLAAGFAARWARPFEGDWPPRRSQRFLFATGWEELRYDSLTDVNFARAGLVTGALALALLTIASAVVYLTSRLEAQTRRMGLLKAVGATPRLAARLALLQQVALTLPAAVVGLTVGWLVAPLLGHPEGAYLLEGTRLPPLDLTTVAVVLAVTVCLTTLPALRPARRAARASTVRMIGNPTRPPRRSGLVIGLSARLPVPALLGVRLASRRPGRALLCALGMGVSVAMVFVALAMEQGIAGDAARQDEGSFGVEVAYDKLRLVVYVFTIALIILAAVNALLIAWVTAVDTAATNALARALGATPRQVGMAVALAQSVPAVLAAVIGVPFGLAVYLAAVATGGEDAASSPGPFLVVAAPAILLLTVALTLVPTQLAARQPVLAALRGDA